MPHILKNGELAVCKCPEMKSNIDTTTPSTLTNGAAFVAAGVSPATFTPVNDVTHPINLMKLSSGKTALIRQTSGDPQIDKKEKILAWIQSKSAYAGEHRLDGSKELKKQMMLDFFEWLNNFCRGRGEFVLKNQNLLKFTGGIWSGQSTLTPLERKTYCDILNKQIGENIHAKDDDDKAPFMYCGFPPFPPLFPEKESDNGEGEKKEKENSKEKETPTEKEKEKRFVLICARDAYRDWWINKHTIKKNNGIMETKVQDKTLQEYWKLLQSQVDGSLSFDDFFLLEGKIDDAITILTNQTSINLGDLVKLERQTSVDSFIALLKEINNQNRGGRRKRKSKKRTRKKKGGRKRRRRKTKKRKTKKKKTNRKTNRKKRKTKRRR